MSERYTRLFALTENLYAKTSPVVIAAGALLKDNQTGKVLAQLKLRNIGEKEIKAATVCLCPLDTVGNTLGSEVEYQYLDLAAVRGECFGTRVPIPLPDASTRAFSASVPEVIFTDNTIWRAADALWETLPIPEKLEDALSDAELVKQYRMRYGADCQYSLITYKDLWCCPCGEWNKQNENDCRHCRKSFATLQAVDFVELRAEKDARLAAEAEAAAAKKAAAEARAEARKNAAEAAARKAKKAARIIIPVLVLAAIAFFAVEKFVVPAAKYTHAVAAMEAGNIVDAYEAFTALGEYKDSPDKASAILPQYVVEKIGEAKVGDYVSFGRYEQDNDASNGKETIEWLVLDVQGDRVLLTSKYALECRSYHTVFGNITWRNCNLREWLNHDFLNTAFTDEEQAVIPTVTVAADKNPNYHTNPGSATQDKVFLLSIDESNLYFQSDDERRCEATAYALRNGSELPCLWLRTPGNNCSYAAYIGTTGIVGSYGGRVTKNGYAVRPVIWVDVSA